MRSDILRVATTEFAANGLAGGRIDEIAAKTKTSKRMIFYYFGDKAGLYREVLEAAYRRVRIDEEGLDLDALEPVAALRRLIAFTFDHHAAHPEFIRLVMIENIHEARYLAHSRVIREVNVSAIAKIRKILRRGRAAAVFRPGVTPLQLHWQISALCFFNVSNRATFAAAFGDSLYDARGQTRLRASVVATVMRFVLHPSSIVRAR